MVAYAPHVAAMTAVGVAAVRTDGIVETRHVYIIVVKTLCKPVGHKEIKHVARIEALVCGSSAVAGLQFIGER